MLRFCSCVRFSDGCSERLQELINILTCRFVKHIGQ